MRPLPLLAAAALALVASGARAQGGKNPKADALFKEGRAAIKAGDYATACPKFAESERLEPAPGTMFELADCEEHFGKLVSSWEHYNVAASGFRLDDPRRKIASDRGAALEPRLAHLTLRLASTAPAGTTVRENDTVVDPASMGQPALADPGALRIVVSAAGRTDRTYTITLKQGEAQTLDLDVGPVPAPVAAPQSTAPATHATTNQSPPATSNGGRTLGFVLGGVGVASLAVGAVTGLMALSDASTVKDHCDANLACDQQGVDAASSGQTLATVSTITVIAGAALTAAGLYLVLTSKAKPESPRAAMVPFATPNGGGAALAGSF
jgi:hypothetical protein